MLVVVGMLWNRQIDCIEEAKAEDIDNWPSVTDVSEEGVKLSSGC